VAESAAYPQAEARIGDVKDTGPDAWAAEEFGRAEIEDGRWRRRLVQMAGRAARRPAGRVTEAFVDDAERQGAYGLLESGEVGAAEVSTAIFEACARRSAGKPFVYCAVDGTSLALTDSGRTKGFGPIGARAKNGQGLKVMNAMVLSPEGIPLGISSQRWWVRPAKKRRKHRDKLKPEQKETHHWLKAMEQTRQVMAAHAPGTRCWFQLDREGDAWPILTAAGLEGHWFTVRQCRKRRVTLADGSSSYLDEVLARQPVRTTYKLQVTATSKRQARVAHMVIRACAVTLDIRDRGGSQKRSSMVVNVVQASELGTTPAGEEPIVWTLLTNRPIQTLKDLTDVVFGYSMRWRIEELHRSWKSGGCRVEETQLRSPSAVIKWATILMSVAIRIERIKRVSREQPERPATDEYTPIEIKAAALLRFGKVGNARISDGPTPTLAEVTLWIAKIGGYTSETSSGGPPGSVTIARGMKELRAAVKALEAIASD